MEESGAALRSAPAWWGCFGSGEDAVDQLAVDVREAHVAAAPAVGGLLVVQAQQVEHGGVEVVDLALVLDGLVAVLVGGAVDRAAPPAAAAGEPEGEAE